MKKKLLSLVLVALAALSLTACSDEGKTLYEMNLDKYLKLPEYEGMTVAVDLYELNEAEYASATEEFFRNVSSVIGVKNRAVATGDVVNIDYAGFKGEEQFAGGTATGAFLEIGSNSFIDGFEDGLIGVTPGATTDLNLTFPTEYPSADLAGAEVVFKVTVNYIVPEYTDANIAALGNEKFSNIAEFETYVRNTLDEELVEDNKELVATKALGQINTNTTYKEIPQFLIDAQKENLSVKYESVAADYGLPLDLYFQYVQGVPLDELSEQYVKERMLLIAIAKDINVEVTDEELEAGLEDLAGTYGITKEELLANNNNDYEYFREFFLAEKVYDYLYENVTITEGTYVSQ